MFVSDSVLMYVCLVSLQIHQLKVTFSSFAGIRVWGLALTLNITEFETTRQIQTEKKTKIILLMITREFQYFQNLQSLLSDLLI